MQLLDKIHTVFTAALRDQDYGNMIIEGEIKIIFVITIKYTGLQFIDMGGLECTTGTRN